LAQLSVDRAESCVIGLLPGTEGHDEIHLDDHHGCAQRGKTPAPPVSSAILLLLCAGLIYFSCEYFVNGVEWVGRKANIAQSAVGTILAAFGTALPESVVTFVAVTFHRSPERAAIGVGAALGGPLVLSTIAYGVAGLCLWQADKQGDVSAEIGGKGLLRSQYWFLTIFVVKVTLGLVAFSLKPWLGILFLVAYAAYFREEMSATRGPEADDLEPLRLRPKDAHPNLGWAVLQTAIALGVIFVASEFFVHQLEAVAPLLGLSATLTALLLSPVATELPETMNAIIWIRQGKAKLAFANISGAMMIQATVPSAFGIFFTPWLFDKSLVLAGAVTMLAVAVLIAFLKSGRLTAGRLMWLGACYALFVLGLLLVGR
jgi:cation:H+ antiporter